MKTLDLTFAGTQLEHFRIQLASAVGKMQGAFETNGRTVLPEYHGVLVQMLQDAVDFLEGSNFDAGPAAPDGAPVNTASPVITEFTGGTNIAEVNDVLICSSGSWTNTPTSYSYQWYKNGVATSTGSTYTVTTGDLGASLYCRVTATNGSGSSAFKQSSNTISNVIPDDDSPTEIPSVTAIPVLVGNSGGEGIGKVGDLLICYSGSWLYSPTSYNYQWRVNGVISENTTNQYELTEAELGATISCSVRACNTNGCSAYQIAVNNLANVTGATGPGLPSNTSNPKIVLYQGTPKAVGTKYFSTPGYWETPGGDLPINIAFQWYRNSSPIAGATVSVYQLVLADVGKTLRCLITASNSVGATTEYTENTLTDIYIP